jgi:bacterioferritin-associated ferredoxin
LLDEVPVVGCIEILVRASIARESWMIVCSCNVLTDVDIRASIATLNDPKHVCDVYASLGCAPKCGGCVGTICALISEAEGRDFGAEQIKFTGEQSSDVGQARFKRRQRREGIRSSPISAQSA